jgi:hypothetical protein
MNPHEKQIQKLLPAICSKISAGKYHVKIGEHEYMIYNHGYYAPDKCIWWEATNLKTNEADFHEHTKWELIRQMQRELSSIKPTPPPTEMPEHYPKGCW